MKLTTLVLALALVAGCKKKDDAKATGPGAGKVASCLMASLQSCREYRDDNLALGTESLQKLCAAGGSDAKFAEVGCPTDKLIATCTKPDGKDYVYEGYFQPAQKVEEDCKQRGGTFG